MSSPVFSSDDETPEALDDLDATATLAAVEQGVMAARAAEVRALRLVQHWAVLHSGPPAPVEGPPTTFADWEAGRTRLVQVGGPGTPLVQDLPICELAIARCITTTAARHLLADALDLDHRLPALWTRLQEGHGQVWVARKVAALSRHLTLDQVATVDVAVAAAVDQAPGRLLKIAEAAILRADPDHARALAAERLRRRCLVINRAADRIAADGQDDGLRTVFARIEAGDAIWLDAMAERIADVLATRPDLTGLDPETTSRDELRALALGWLAHPEDVIALLAGTYRTDSDSTDSHSTNTHSTGTPRPSRQRAVLHVHVTRESLTGGDGVARVEELGPILLDQLRGLLGHSHITLTPVIDLATSRSVNGYEHPTDIAQRAFLRTTGDVFPHAVSQSRRLDNDHPSPHDRAGPPGQTGDHNIAPLGRRHHRAKTHEGYQLHQLAPDRYIWRSPHGLWRLVDPTGTHVLDDWTAQRLMGCPS